ncbi:hypothetical protein GLOIN_2v1722020 [Rhizophagus clarus]|uniref:BTB domain-containing protein n=1 Tax=Rhizophagus clarus TaxID=94130 RepID=A0A8H3L9T7_9GLOM|nr:hypothetical protein GLOIN_2v1722020 [Rhizophagus clarus]
MDSKLHDDLIKDLSSMINDSEDYNVIIQVGENHNTKEFRIHSNILRARSPYFRKQLSAKWGSNNHSKFKRDHITVFKKSHISPNVFEIILKYIYTGEADFYKKSGRDIFEVLVTSNEFLLEKLYNCVQDHLIEKQSIWIKQNFNYVFYTVFKLVNCKKMQDYCIECMSEDSQLFNEKNFSFLDKDNLYDLLKRENLQIEEIVIWEYLIKWGIEQTPGLRNKGNDRDKWNDHDYEALKETISQFIPLIRFVEISPADFFDRVRPYKDVIPFHIYEEVAEFYYKNTMSKTTILPPRTGKFKIESNIIKPKLANIIASWIEKKDENNLPLKDKYSFDLLYCGSKDGFNPKSFRVKCNHQGPCLVLVKKKSTKIYGGYNPIGFTNTYRRYCPTNDSFIFSFENSEDTQNMKISRVNSKHTNRAIYEHRINGFNFDLNTSPIPEEIEVLKISLL